MIFVSLKLMTFVQFVFICVISGRMQIFYSKKVPSDILVKERMNIAGWEFTQPTLHTSLLLTPIRIENL
jgi:hypothetical protein